LILIDAKELALLVFDIQLIRREKNVLGDVLNVKVENWTDKKIKMKFEFKDNLKVSSEQSKDKLRIKVKESAEIYFITDPD
jgi:hypothetical protein